MRRDAPERLRYSVRVNDHDHRAVAEDGRAGKHRDVPQLRRQRLDHDLFGMEYAIDHDAEGLAADLGDDHEAFVVRAWPELQQFLELNERQQLVAQPQHRRVLDAFDVMLAAVGGAHQFQDGKLRYGKALGAGFDDERGDDRQRQRYFDRECRSRARPRFQVDRAADLLDVGAHHVHADAAAGNAGDRRSGREARA